MSDPVIIASYARTPMGGFQGALSGVTAVELGATAVRAAVERSKVDPAIIDRIYMGCVLPAGLGQAPARQAALGAGLPNSVEATTVNKMCGSGMQATIMAAEALMAGTVDVVIAGGMESMTNAPFLLAKHRSGARIGHDVVSDSMMLDGLEDAYDKGKPMGAFAEDTARDYQFTREDQDAFAIESLTRASAAITGGGFTDEVVPVTVKTRGGDVVVDEDEQPGKAKPAKIPGLRPAFAKDGTRRRDPESARSRRLERRGRRPVRGERSVRDRRDDRDARARHPPRQAERQRRCDRAGPSDRRQRCAHHRHAGRCTEITRPEQRRRRALHRWWRSNGGGGRTDPSVT